MGGFPHWGGRGRASGIFSTFCVTLSLAGAAGPWVRVHAGEAARTQGASAGVEDSSASLALAPFAPRFLAACLLPSPLKAVRAQVDAIRAWAKDKEGARDCFTSARALAQAVTVEIEGRGLRRFELLREARSAKRIYLAGNALKDVSFLSGLVQLETLDLRGNPIAFLPSDVLGRLRVLNVSGTGFRSLVDLAPATGLVDLNAHGLGLMDLRGLESFPHLVSLGLSSNALESVDEISELQELRYLYVPFNRLRDLSAVGRLPFLKLLNAKGNPLDAPEICPHPEAICVLE